MRWSVVLGLPASVATILTFLFLDAPAAVGRWLSQTDPVSGTIALDTIQAIPDLAAAHEVYRARSRTDLVVIGGEITGVDDTPTGTFFDVLIHPSDKSYAYAKVLLSRPVAPRIFVTAALSARTNAFSLEIQGLNDNFLIRSNGDDYMIYNSEDNQTPWRPLPPVYIGGYTLGLLQVGRRVRVFFNSQPLDSLDLWSTPPSGQVGVFFKSGSQSAATARFGRLAVYQF